MPEQIAIQDQTASEEKSNLCCFLNCLLRQGKVGKKRCVKGNFEVAYSVNTDQTALIDNLICVTIFAI